MEQLTKGFAFNYQGYRDLINRVNVISVSTVAEWLISITIQLWSLLVGEGEVLLWQSPANLTCGPVYGAYQETHFTRAGKAMPEKSIILIKPWFAFFGFKWGMSIEGVCHKRRQELRNFESLKVSVRTKNPVTVDYSYLANAKGIPFYNNGYIRFGDQADGQYMQANGYFDIPGSIRWSKHPRNRQIRFHWERISPEDICAKTGKGTLKSIRDIRRYLHNGGDL